MMLPSARCGAPWFTPFTVLYSSKPGSAPLLGLRKERRTALKHDKRMSTGCPRLLIERSFQ
jgi:hypothetical protein